MKQQQRHEHVEYLQRSHTIVAPLVVLVLTLVTGLACSASSQLDAEAIAIHNRGIALMGHFDYNAALAEFQKVLERYPDNPDVLVNVGIALLNRQGEGDEVAALEMLHKALEISPSNDRAQYCTGLIVLHQGRPEEAIKRFQKVFEIDDKDADAAYYIGQCFMQMGDTDNALTWYRKAIELDPYLRSAYYTGFQALQRLRQMDEAREFLNQFKRLDENPQARLAEFKYTKMGVRGNVKELGKAPATAAPRPAGGIFEQAKSIQLELGEHAWREQEDAGAGSITACDIDGNGSVDYFIAGALAPGNGAHNAVLLAGKNPGEYTIVLDHPLALVENVHAALWGDIDNDGLNDVYLCRQGPNQLWRQEQPGLWRDVTESTGTSNGAANTVDGAMLDADHDGDLDLFLINQDKPNELLNNDRNGSFRSLAAQLGLTGKAEGSRSLVIADIDHDRDSDLLIINQEPPHEVLRNDLLWEYAPADGWDDFAAADIVAAVAGDLDADGRPEIYTADSSGLVSCWRDDGDGAYHPERLATRVISTALSGEDRLALADLDGDGTIEVLAMTPKGLQVHANDEVLKRLDAFGDEDKHRLAGWTCAPYTPARGPALVAWSAGEPPLIWAPGPGRYPFIGFTLSGKEAASKTVRSNVSGIGTRIAVRIGAGWTVISNFRQSSGPGQSLTPMLVGAGGRDAIDFVAIDWTDGVYQTELGLKVAEVHTIAETQRQMSSCPVLFAFNGERYEFVTDLLGVGGVGYALGPPGEYGVPRPWENIQLPPGSLMPRDGRLLLKLSEPMEEIAYIDEVELTAYDLPPGWQMTLDERMVIAGPAATGQPVFYRRIAEIEEARNDRGDLVTEAVRDRDHRAAPVGELDHRFIGMLAQNNVVSMTFAQALGSVAGEPVLVADGWIEYPYSQTNFAAWQAGAELQAPTLAVAKSPGEWRVLLDQFGYPAGMPRQMSVPLQGMEPGTQQLRLSTNQEIYWDRLFVAYAEPCPQVVKHELDLVTSKLQQTGFANRSTFGQHRPYYDYSRRQPLWDAHYMEGFYTRTGVVDELVTAADDAVAIFGAGEEIHLEFAAPGQPLPPGWSRVYVLKTRGWCKDMDLYTKDGDTVEPLPSAGVGGELRASLHKAYNTRFVAGRD